MIDPFQITNKYRTDAELEEFLLFAICVSGKTAVVISRQVEVFLKMAKDKYGELSPFQLLELMNEDGSTVEFLKKAKLGKYNMLKDSLKQLVNLKSLRTCSTNDLEKIKGIGPKTSRFFILHSREKARVAALDTHILHYLRDNGVDSPKSTPSSKRYAELEGVFIGMADKAGKDIAEFDLEIWTRYTKTKPWLQTLELNQINIAERKENLKCADDGLSASLEPLSRRHNCESFSKNSM